LNNKIIIVSGFYSRNYNFRENFFRESFGKRGYHVIVISSKYNPYNTETLNNFGVIRVKSIIIKDFIVPLSFIKILRVKPDFVICLDARQFITVFFGILFAIRGFKIIYDHEQRNFNGIQGIIQKILVHLMFFISSRIRVVHPDALKKLKKLESIYKDKILYSMLEPSNNFCKAAERARNLKFKKIIEICIFGRYEVHKNIDFFVKKLVESFPEIKICIAGPGMSNCSIRAKNLIVKDKFFKPLSRALLFRSSKVCLFFKPSASYYEVNLVGTPLIIPEYSNNKLYPGDNFRFTSADVNDDGVTVPSENNFLLYKNEISKILNSYN
jgi:hypothetical protein